MTRSHRRPRTAARRVGVAVVSTALLAGGLSTLAAGGAQAATLLPGPVVVGPTDSAPVRKEVVLDWAPMPGASRYVVQVGTDEQWSDTPTLQLSTVATRLTLPVALPHASYVWRVAAVGAAGQGRWSTDGTFTRGWLTKPTGLAVTYGGGLPSFAWQPIATASEYQLQVSTSPYFDDRAPTTTQAGSVTETCFTTRTTVTPANGQADSRNGGAGDCNFSGLGTGETRYWRVRGLDHVVDDVPVVDTTPVVDEGISHLPPTTAGGLDTTACPSSACEPSNTVEKGAWSLPSTFASTWPAPAPDDTRRYESLPLVTVHPVTEHPLCAADAVCRDFPTLRWDPVAGADWYRVYVSLDEAYSNIQEIVETPGHSWTPTAQWRDSTAQRSYFYTVQPCTSTGTTPGCGAVTDQPASFRKSSPKLATAPTAQGTETVLSWQSHADAMRAAGVPATSEAYAYHVQVSTPANPDFLTGGLVDEAEVDSTHHVSAVKSYGDGDFLWRVQAIDASGHKLPWSAVRSFSRDGRAPAFSVGPAQVAVNGTLKVAFSEPVTGVSTSSIVVGGTGYTVTPSADRRSATVTPSARLLPGAVHWVKVTSAVRDDAGNPVAERSVPVLVSTVVDDRSPGMVLGGGWTRLSSSNAWSGTYSRAVPTSRAWSIASVSMSARGYAVKGCVGPANGIVEIWVDGVRVSRFDSYRSYSGCAVTFAKASFASPGKHRVEVRGLGAKNALSKGTAIGIDVMDAVR